MASRITCTWVIWLLVLSTSALLQGATARDRDETSKQGGTASKKRNAKIAGCVAYDAAGKCNNCTSPRYTLTADGACDCSPGYERSSANSTCKRGGACLNKCGATYLDDGKGGNCSCDYWCDNHGDCCGGAASKNALCKTMTPTLNKARTGSCSVGASQAAASVTRGFRPVTCWCDSYCTNNNDCCPLCTQPRCNKQSGSTSNDSRSSDAAAVAAIQEVRDSSSSSIEDVGSSLRARVAAEAAALARESGHLSDCPVHHRVQEMKAAIAATVGPAAGGYEVSSERIMQECQAQDEGAPQEPFIMPVHWTAAQVCDDSSCVGGK